MRPGRRIERVLPEVKNDCGGDSAVHECLFCFLGRFRLLFVLLFESWSPFSGHQNRLENHWERMFGR
jgi:hypothetical protein